MAGVRDDVEGAIPSARLCAGGNVGNAGRDLLSESCAHARDCPAAHLDSHRSEDECASRSNAIRFVEYEYNGEDRLLIIGPDRHGRLLEIVAVPAVEPTRIIHADALRPKFYDCLK